MKLDTGGHIHSANVSEEDLIRTFDNDHGRGDFIILSLGSQVYLQASGKGEGPYQMEYREGDENHHFTCTEELSKDKVKKSFLKYLEGDSSWKVDHCWEQSAVFLRKKPWWKLW